MKTYMCPNCGRVYNYADECTGMLINCMNCRYPLKSKEDVKQIKRPELNKHNIVGNIPDPTKSIPKCPTCQSTNISKIGALNRMASVGLFGLASSKIGKTHKCNSCGSTW